MVHISNAVVDEIAILVLFCCNFRATICEVKRLPPFEPNDYLLETQKDKGNNQWEIYAWAVGEIMSKSSGLPKHN